MEKLGIANEDLVQELKADYRRIRESLTNLTKLGWADPAKSKALEAQLEAIKERIDATEASKGN